MPPGSPKAPRRERHSGQRQRAPCGRKRRDFTQDLLPQSPVCHARPERRGPRRGPTRESEYGVGLRSLDAFRLVTPETGAFVAVTGDRGGRTRTRDLRFWRPPLYQLSYTPRACRILPNAASLPAASSARPAARSMRAIRRVGVASTRPVRPSPSSGTWPPPSCSRGQRVVEPDAVGLGHEAVDLGRGRARPVEGDVGAGDAVEHPRARLAESARPTRSMNSCSGGSRLRAPSRAASSTAASPPSRMHPKRHPPQVARGRASRGVFRSPWASSQTTATRPCRRASPATAPTWVQQQPPSTTGRSRQRVGERLGLLAQVVASATARRLRARRPSGRRASSASPPCPRRRGTRTSRRRSWPDQLVERVAAARSGRGSRGRAAARGCLAQPVDPHAGQSQLAGRRDVVEQALRRRAHGGRGPRPSARRTRCQWPCAGL